MSDEKKVILVTGATGNVGRQVVTQLMDTDGVRVRALTRHPESAFLPREADIVRGDMLEPEALAGQLDGVDAVFLVWRSLGADPAPFINTVAKSARRMVFLSTSAISDGVEKQSNPIGQLHADIERLIEQSGMEWTFLRPGGFAANARLWWGPQISEGDVVRWPYGAAAWAPIDERDIAAIAVQALAAQAQTHVGAKYYLTGEQSLTQAQQVNIISEAIGRSLRFEEISPGAAREQLSTVFPPVAMEMMLDFWANMTKEPALITDTVAKITGRPAHTFRQWAIDHAGDFSRS
ncbi:MAG: NAD(P)H-binding protein [Blastocatellia bacterium]|nr:NAD(P)H-binding protein [Blastocatellia bacterium]